MIFERKRKEKKSVRCEWKYLSNEYNGTKYSNFIGQIILKIKIHCEPAAVCECTQKLYYIWNKKSKYFFFLLNWPPSPRQPECRAPKKVKMSEHDFKLNVDSLIERLLEGKLYWLVRKVFFICKCIKFWEGMDRLNESSLQFAMLLNRYLMQLFEQSTNNEQ